MRQSKLFAKTLREAPADEVSTNASLLIRAGFIDKVMAGVYSYLPLGLKVLEKVKEIVRQEMDKLGAQEILMPALHPKDNYLKTERWDKIDVLFKLDGASGSQYALGSTHEEIVTPLAKKFVSSYKDLPLSVYQIQDKFRNEPRAKSGLLRGREFSMKDLYSFHKDQEDLDNFYNKSKAAYLEVFKRCGLKAILVEASGGVFSKYSHEFQVATENGEDTVVVCGSCDFAQNREICELADNDMCPNCDSQVKVIKAIEVGNIFKLKDRLTKAFDFEYTDEEGRRQPVLMGCYGIGPSRVLGSVVEVHHDDKGIIWPKELTPFKAHLIILDESKKDEADKLYDQLTATGWQILYDDRQESAGVKLNDADLLGVTVQLIIGSKTNKSVEFKLRATGEVREVKYNKVEEELKKIYN